MSFEVILSQIGFLNFAVASVLSIRALKDESNRGFGVLAKIATMFFGFAFLAICFVLAARVYQGNFIIAEARTWILTIVIASLGLFAHFRLKMRTVIAFVAPLTTLTMLAHFIQAPKRSQSALQEFSELALSFHIAGALMGQFVAVVASVIAVMYLWQQRVLKQKLIAQMTSRVPALDLLEKALFASLWVGFLFLTAALLSGAFYLQFYQVAKAAYLEKIIWAISVWVWYLVALLARNVLGVPVKRVAQMSIGGFLLLSATFFGLSFLN